MTSAASANAANTATGKSDGAGSLVPSTGPEQADSRLKDIRYISDASSSILCKSSIAARATSSETCDFKAFIWRYHFSAALGLRKTELQLVGVSPFLKDLHRIVNEAIRALAFAPICTNLALDPFEIEKTSSGLENAES